MNRLALFIAGALLLLSCAPGNGRALSTPSEEQPAPKTLRIGMLVDREQASPAMFGRSGSGSDSGSGSPSLEFFYTFHANLTVFDPSGAVVPQIAQKVPSLQDGDWKLLPAGGMEVTWKLRPGAQWHDATPLTADDFVFGYELLTDPALPISPGELANVSSVQATDPQTLVISWRNQNVAGGINGFDGIPAAPRHIFGELHAAGDPQAFMNSAYWNTQFIGLGPYRLGTWEHASYLEGIAFDGYFGGRPRIDRVVLQFLGNVNALIASLLSGDIDIIPLGATLDVQPMIAVRDQWAASGAGTTLAVAKGVRSIYLQFRDPTLPFASDVRVRQAMLHALDRDSIVATLEAGLTQRADFFVPTGDPVLELAERRALPLFPFDPTRALQLLNEAGWSRGSDGVLRNGAGKTLQISVATSAEGTNPEEAAIVASNWSSAGFAAEPAPYAQTAQNRAQLANNFSSTLIKPWNFAVSAPGNLRTSQMGTQANAWGGNNYGGYANPDYDRLYGALANDLDPARRQEALFRMIQLIDEQLPLLPIFYVPQTMAFRTGVAGPGLTSPLQAGNAWNIATWDIR
ncbi:MAG TPA: peptide ABC transporter substrate-binding protein [Chloroflexota bacterium]